MRCNNCLRDDGDLRSCQNEDSLCEDCKAQPREIKIEKDPSEACSTYFDTADEIAKIPYPIGSPEWRSYAAAKIKRFGKE